MSVDFEKLLATYFGNVNARNAQGVVEMYAADGQLILHNGMRIQGRPALFEFFSNLFLQAPPAPRVINIVGGGLQCAAELGVTLPGGTEQPVADFFRLDASGLIASLTIYASAAPSVGEMPKS